MNSVTNSAIRSRKYQVKRNKLNKTKQIKKHLNVQNYYLKNAKKNKGHYLSDECYKIIADCFTSPKRCVVLQKKF